MLKFPKPVPMILLYNISSFDSPLVFFHKFSEPKMHFVLLFLENWIQPVMILTYPCLLSNFFLPCCFLCFCLLWHVLQQVSELLALDGPLAQPPELVLGVHHPPDHLGKAECIRWLEIKISSPGMTHEPWLELRTFLKNFLTSCEKLQVCPFLYTVTRSPNNSTTGWSLLDVPKVLVNNFYSK